MAKKKALTKMMISKRYIQICNLHQLAFKTVKVSQFARIFVVLISVAFKVPAMRFLLENKSGIFFICNVAYLLGVKNFGFYFREQLLSHSCLCCLAMIAPDKISTSLLDGAV